MTTCKHCHQFAAMSVDVHSRLTKDDDGDGDDDIADISRDLMLFCMNLVDCAQWNSLRQFICGSSVEIPFSYGITEPFNINEKLFDMDGMLHVNNLYAGHRLKLLPETYSGNVIRIYTDDTHTGYVRLIREKDNTELQLSDLAKLIGSSARHGPALL